MISGPNLPVTEQSFSLCFASLWPKKKSRRRGGLSLLEFVGDQLSMLGLGSFLGTRK